MKLLHRIKTVSTGVFAVCLVMGCATTTNRGDVDINRSQLMLVSDSQMNQEGEFNYQQLLAEAQRKGQLNTDASTLRRSREIAGRLAAQSGIFRPDAKNWKWEVNVISSDEVNAFCYPGGKIIVLTGLVDTLKPTDDELAAILGHEISHALREHSREQASQGVITNLAVAAAQTKLGDLAGMLGQSWMMYNSRTAETEADRMGIELMARAGYNPDGAISLWRKMGAYSGNQTNLLWWLQSHPSDSDRMATLSKDAITVRPLYEEAKKHIKQTAPVESDVTMGVPEQNTRSYSTTKNRRAASAKTSKKSSGKKTVNKKTTNKKTAAKKRNR